MKLVISVVLFLSVYFLKIATTNGQLGSTFQYPTLHKFKLIQQFESGKCLNVYVREISGDHHGYEKFTDTDKKLSGGSSLSDWEKWLPTAGSETEILKVRLGECPGESEKSAASYDDGDDRGDHHVVKANDVNFESQTFHLLSGGTPDMPNDCVYADTENFYIVDANKCDPGNPKMLFSLISIPGEIDTHQIIHTASGLCFHTSNILDGAASRLLTCDAADPLQWWRICDNFGQCSWSPSPPDDASEPVGPGEQRSTRKARSVRKKRGFDGQQGPPGFPGTPGPSATRGGQGGIGGSGGRGGLGGSDSGNGGYGGSGGPGGPGGGCGSGGQGAPGGNGGPAGPPGGGGSPGFAGWPGAPGSTGAPGAAGEPGTPGGHGSAGGPGSPGGLGGQGGAGGSGGACLRRSNSPAGPTA